MSTRATVTIVFTVAVLAFLSWALFWDGLITFVSPTTIRGLLLKRSAPVDPRPGTQCGSPLDRGLNLGFRIQTFSSGLRAAIWYPVTSAEASYQYPYGLNTSLAFDAPVADCTQYPLVVFSHGFGGCGIQTAFFTEELARAGYIVVAPDHKDALCKVDQPLRGNILRGGDEPFLMPGKWSDSTYRDRAADIELVINEILRDTRFGARIDASRIGAAGHSLGGYTVLGMAGGWPSWKDQRIKAALMMSPYVNPYLSAGTLGAIRTPLMYQGGTRDYANTPKVKRTGGAYDSSNSPKYFVDFKDADHLTWSNLLCMPVGVPISGCLEKSSVARLINQYGIAFMDRYLKARDEPLLDQPNAEVAEYRYAN